MRILQLCKKSPTPQKDGESIAIHQISKALQSIGAEVDVLAMLTSKHKQYDDKAELNGVRYQYVTVDTDISISKAILSGFDKTPYLVSRFEEEGFQNALVKLLEDESYDFIILEGVFLGLYLATIKKKSQAKIVLRAHNVENQIWKRLVVEEKSALKKAYLRYFVVEQFQKFEDDIISKVDGVLPISPIDNQYFIKNKVKNTLTVPVCVDGVRQEPLPEQFHIGFLGGMDWLPNRKGVDWFIDEVWIKFLKKHQQSEVRFHLAGRNFPDDLLVKCEKAGVKALGEINDAYAFIGGQSVMIAPIFSGSGMRVKIIEAMSLGRTVLSTTVGAEGINYTNTENIYIADTAEEWLAVLENLLINPNKVVSVGEKASALIAEEYLMENYADNLKNFLNGL